MIRLPGGALLCSSAGCESLLSHHRSIYSGKASEAPTSCCRKERLDQDGDGKVSLQVPQLEEPFLYRETAPGTIL